jgi:APA family basic amino acid/polyamine antiporter
MAKQQVGLVGAVAIGLASMLGAGVFVVFHNAYAITPTGYFYALALAALVAVLNAWSVYSLARQIERPGGIYAYSREYLNPAASFSAGFAFVFGKIGSIAAIALTFNYYVAPGVGFWPAALAIAGMATINILGIQRTASVAAVLATLTSVYLLTMLMVGVASPAPMLVLPAPDAPPAFGNVLSAAAIFFFAFAGYARVATLGNEVRDARRNIPKAIVIALGFVIVIYFGLALVLQKVLGLNLFTDVAPFKTLSVQLLPGVPVEVTTAVAVFASLGSVLALLAGVSRTAAIMGEDGELPAFLTKRNATGSPWLAEALIAFGAIALVSVGNLSWVIGFSSFSVLFYYSIGHLSALRQPCGVRIFPRWLAILGFLLCWSLMLTVPGPAVPISVAILVLANTVRFVVRRRK